MGQCSEAIGQLRQQRDGAEAAFRFGLMLCDPCLVVFQVHGAVNGQRVSGNVGVLQSQQLPTAQAGQQQGHNGNGYALTVVAHGEIEDNADFFQGERLPRALLDMREFDAGSGILLAQVVVHGRCKQGVQKHMELVHVGLGSGKAEVIDKPLQVHGEDSRQLQVFQLLGYLSGNQPQGIVGVWAYGVQFVGGHVFGNPLSQCQGQSPPSFG